MLDYSILYETMFNYSLVAGPGRQGPLRLREPQIGHLE